MVRTVALALLAGVLAVTAGMPAARAQSFNILPDKPSKTPDEIEREQAAERQYKESLKAIPDKKASSDPWGALRGAEPAKNAGKPAPKAVSGSAQPAPKSAAAKTGTAAPKAQ